MVKDTVHPVAILIIVTFVVLLGLIGSSREARDEQVILFFPEPGDFPNEDEGTVVFDFQFPEGGFKVDGKTPDVLMLMNSEKLPELKIGYDTREKRLYAGLPVIVSEEIELIDGQKHMITYTFSRQRQRQGLYLDGALLVEGEFTGKKAADFFTANLARKGRVWKESPIPIGISYS